MGLIPMNMDYMKSARLCKHSGKIFLAQPDRTVRAENSASSGVAGLGEFSYLNTPEKLPWAKLGEAAVQEGKRKKEKGKSIPRLLPFSFLLLPS
jgi:hypothetical protein